MMAQVAAASPGLPSGWKLCVGSSMDNKLQVICVSAPFEESSVPISRGLICINDLIDHIFDSKCHVYVHVLSDISQGASYAGLVQQRKAAAGTYIRHALGRRASLNFSALRPLQYFNKEMRKRLPLESAIVCLQAVVETGKQSFSSPQEVREAVKKKLVAIACCGQHVEPWAKEIWDNLPYIVEQKAPTPKRGKSADNTDADGSQGKTCKQAASQYKRRRLQTCDEAAQPNSLIASVNQPAAAVGLSAHTQSLACSLQEKSTLQLVPSCIPPSSSLSTLAHQEGAVVIISPSHKVQDMFPLISSHTASKKNLLAAFRKQSGPSSCFVPVNQSSPTATCQGSSPAPVLNLQGSLPASQLTPNLASTTPQLANINHSGDTPLATPQSANVNAETPQSQATKKVSSKLEVRDVVELEFLDTPGHKLHQKRCGIRQTQFTVQEELGQGASARVYGGRCEEQDSTSAQHQLFLQSGWVHDFAMKVFLAGSDPKFRFKRSPRALRDAVAAVRQTRENEEKAVVAMAEAEVDCPYITEYWGFAIIKGTDIYVLLMQRGKSTLYDHMRRVCFAILHTKLLEVQQIAIQVVTGMYALEQKGLVVLHRDIKSENIMIDAATNPRITDFGSAKVLNSSHSLARTCIGTPGSMAPEVLRNKGCDERSGWWSTGCLVYEMAVGQLPFGRNLPELLYNTESQEAINKYLQQDEGMKSLPQQLQFYISECLKFDPAARAPLAKQLTLLKESLNP